MLWTNKRNPEQQSKQGIAVIVKKYKLQRKQNEHKRHLRLKSQCFVCEHCGQLSSCSNPVSKVFAEAKQGVLRTSQVLKDVATCSAKFTTRPERKLYLCGGCCEGFNDIELLVGHVRSCGIDHGLNERKTSTSGCTDEKGKWNTEVAFVKSNKQARAKSPGGCFTKGLQLENPTEINSNIDRNPVVKQPPDYQSNQVLLIDNSRTENFFDVQRANDLAENASNVEKRLVCVKKENFEAEDNTINDSSNEKPKAKPKARVRASKLQAANPNNECVLCHKTFAQKSSLNRHLSLVHEGVKKFKCHKCHKSYQQKHNLIHHKCVGETPATSNSLLCTMCGKYFSAVSCLKHHERTVHSEIKRFPCATCGKAFSSAGNMREHVQSIHEGRAYLCLLCGRRFSFKNSFNRHQRFHTGVKAYKCQHCGKAFASREGWRLHELTHVVTSDKVQCEYCGKKMKNLLCVSYHMRKHHSSDDQKQLQCYRCKTRCDDSIGLVKHMEECEKNQHTCQQCFKTFSSKSNLNAHMKTHTAKRTPDLPKAIVKCDQTPELILSTS